MYVPHPHPRATASQNQCSSPVTRLMCDVHGVDEIGQRSFPPSMWNVSTGDTDPTVLQILNVRCPLKGRTGASNLHLLDIDRSTPRLGLLVLSSVTTPRVRFDTVPLRVGGWAETICVMARRRANLRKAWGGSYSIHLASLDSVVTSFRQQTRMLIVALLPGEPLIVCGYAHKSGAQPRNTMLDGGKLEISRMGAIISIGRQRSRRRFVVWYYMLRKTSFRHQGSCQTLKKQIQNPFRGASSSAERT